MVAREPRRLVIGISGATGIAYGIRALELAHDAGVGIHLVATKPADLTRACETDISASTLHSPAAVN